MLGVYLREILFFPFKTFFDSPFNAKFEIPCGNVRQLWRCRLEIKFGEAEPSSNRHIRIINAFRLCDHLENIGRPMQGRGSLFLRNSRRHPYFLRFLFFRIFINQNATMMPAPEISIPIRYASSKPFGDDMVQGPIVPAAEKPQKMIP